jgi:FixJ family two-component response regulator
MATVPSIAVIEIVEDDDSMRMALKRLLLAHGYETRAFVSAAEFLIAERPKRPACLILDVRLPGPSGLDLHEAIAQDEAPLPVVFLTGHGDIPMCVRAIQAGAVDFLTKPVQQERLLGAIEKALLRDAEQRAIAEGQRVLRQRYQQLTPRERQVCALVVEGRLNKQIACELGTAERTIKAHRAQVMKKMGVDSLAALVRAADKLNT